MGSAGCDGPSNPCVVNHQLRVSASVPAITDPVKGGSGALGERFEDQAVVRGLAFQPALYEVGHLNAHLGTRLSGQHRREHDVLRIESHAAPRPAAQSSELEIRRGRCRGGHRNQKGLCRVKLRRPRAQPREVDAARQCMARTIAPVSSDLMCVGGQCAAGRNRDPATPHNSHASARVSRRAFTREISSRSIVNVFHEGSFG